MKYNGSMSSIVLVGFMGSGKSTVGRLTAEGLHATFVDLDEEIAALEGRTIPEIFETRGEAVFRTVETAALKRALQKHDVVIAAGGGLFSEPVNRELIRAGGASSVFLDVPWEILAGRIGRDDPGRPLWTDPEAAEALFRRRREDYGKADVRIEVTQDMNPLQTVEAVFERLGRRPCDT